MSNALIPFYRGTCQIPICGAPIDSTYSMFVDGKFFCPICEVEHDPGILYYVRLANIDGRVKAGRCFIKNLCTVVKLLGRHGWTISELAQVTLEAHSSVVRINTATVTP